jgi:anti-repressor protein
MNELQIFNSEEFGEIRTVTVNDEVWFVAKDVCEALKHTNTTVAMQMLEEDERTKLSLGRAGETNCINESGLYTLIIKSNLPKAKKFRKWVTSEVIPSIRKNGGYIAGQETLSDEELMAKALLVANNKIAERDKIIEQKQARIEQMKPKEIFADAVATSHTSILVGDLAKLICQNGYQIGAKRLFSWLRDNGYLIKRKGADWNMPTQKSMEMGLFEIKESTHINGSGCNVTTRTPKITGKAQVYFVNKFLKGVKNETA